MSPTMVCGAMAHYLVNLAVSAFVITFATWLSKRYPATAGFLTALPITTMLVLVLGYVDGVTGEQRTSFARSLMVALPLSVSFLIPFAVGSRLGLGFSSAFAAGVALLGVGYMAHRFILGAA
jgi:hypothetical protein